MEQIIQHHREPPCCDEHHIGRGCGCHCCCHEGGKDGENLPRLSLKDISPRLPDYFVDEYKQEQFLKLYPTKDCGPHIAEFSPWSACAGSLIVIIGHGFAPGRNLNTVTIGGSKALVVTAERHRIIVISDFKVQDGPVIVKTSHGQAKGPRNFKLLSYPAPNPESDGPPISFEGVGDGTWTDLRTQLSSIRPKIQLASPTVIHALGVPKTGTAKVLAVCCHPSDVAPANAATAKANIIGKCASMTKYYNQASYGALNVSVDVIGYFTMANKFAHYYRANTPGGPPGYPNFNEVVLGQIQAEAASYAVAQGYDLNTYDVLMIVVYMNTFVRAWAPPGGTGLNIAYSQPATPDQAAVSVSMTLKKSLGQVTLGDNADASGTNVDTNWGRYAHEFGHNVVPPAAVLKEDIYASDTGPGADVSGAPFDLMGYHDLHPLFSGWNIDGLGWFTTSGAVQNTVVLHWDRNSFSRDFEIVAHGLVQNTNASRCHLVRIQVSAGLEYYVEVRQTPGTTAQVFDSHLPVPAGKDGGVLVTRSISGTLNNNEQIRLITLLQASSTTLVTGQVAVDPLRTLLITVLDDNVQASPRVCKVRIEWAQPATGTPGGTFDLYLQPWDSSYTSPDIWIDRSPFYVAGDPTTAYDHHDAAGNPVNGGDAPRLDEINKYYARVHNAGTQSANNIIATLYVNTPPGIGDSGTWTPLRTIPIPTIAANSSVDIEADWNPQVGDHTCLQVAVVAQTGEVSVSNNKAQENVFTFYPASHSVPEPIELSVNIQNPLNRRTLVSIVVDGVPAGFYVYFPRRYLYLEALGQQRLELLVIPRREVKDLKTKIANIRVHGYIPWQYLDTQPINNLPPGSTMRLIGGIQSIVAPKIGSQITLQPNPKAGDNVVTVTGNVTPPTAAQSVRVDMTAEDGSSVSRSASTNRSGTFTATFPLPTERIGGGISISAATTVTLAFQAHIINADTLGPSDSNIVHFVTQLVQPPTEEPPK